MQNEEQLEFFKHTLLEKQAIRLIIERSGIEDVVPEKNLPKDTEPEVKAASSLDETQKDD